MISYANKIPNHPKVCKGCHSPEYDSSQCRLCWLAAYDLTYRKRWGISSLVTPPSPSPQAVYPCIHRTKDSFPLPGCGTCNGALLVHGCNNTKLGISRCLVSGYLHQENNARAQGMAVCRDCGWREPESNLEIPLGEFRLRLEQGTLPSGWQHWKVALYGMLDFLREQAALNPGYPRDVFSGRGIVTAAGGPTYFRCAFAQYLTLRKQGCRLPYQMWYLGPREMDRIMLLICEEFGIEAVDATGQTPPPPGQHSFFHQKKPRILNGWELKPFATAHSRFEEVLFLDADNTTGRNPEFLFDEPEYLDKGAAFWPDVIDVRDSLINSNVWTRIGRPSQSKFLGFESGQYLVNKSRSWRELCLTMWFNDYSDYWYQFIYGDKDTFLLAWASLDSDFHYPSPPYWQSPCIVQKDFRGFDLFYHASRGKEQLVRGEPTHHHADNEAIAEAHQLLEQRIKVLTRATGETTMLQQTSTPPRYNSPWRTPNMNPVSFQQSPPEKN